MPMHQGGEKIFLCSEQIIVMIELFPKYVCKIIELAKGMPRLVSHAFILELCVCQMPSENAGSERTTIICSNNGAGHQNNACMKGSAPSHFSAVKTL